MVKKKFFAKALAFAMATGLLASAIPVGAAPVQALAEDQAEEGEAKAVSAEVQYDSYVLKITPNEGDHYVFLDVLKKADDTKPTTYPYPCKDGVVYIDLSFLKVNKESYLKVYGDTSTTKVAITVAAQPAKVKFKYANQTWPVKGENESEEDYQKKVVTYYMDSFSITGDAAKADFQIRSMYGNSWGDLVNESSDTLATMKVAGATVYLRQKAVDTKIEDNKVTVAGQPAGPEAKVKITAAPKAPKITIDYAKGMIKLPKNAQYGIFDADGNLEYVDGSEKGGAISTADILKAVAEKRGLKDTEENKAVTEFVEKTIVEGFNLVVRTNDKKKNSISNPQFVTVKGAPTFSDDENGKLLGSDGKTEIATYKFDDKDGAVLTFGSGAFEYKDDKTGNWKKITSGKGIKGKTSLTIRIAGFKAKDEKDSTLPSYVEKTIAKDMTEVTVSGDKTVEATKTIKLTVTAKDKKGEAVSNPTVTWKSSDEAVATVADGTVTGVKEGKCTITATVKIGEANVEGTIEIEVTAKKE